MENQRFNTTAGFIDETSETQPHQWLSKLERQHARQDLLILHDVGFIPLHPPEAKHSTNSVMTTASGGSSFFSLQTLVSNVGQRSSKTSTLDISGDRNLFTYNLIKGGDTLDNIDINIPEHSSIGYS